MLIHYALRKLNAPCRVIMTLVKTKSEVSALKTPVPHMLQNNLVYQIKCPGCSASYVGQTSRLLQQRFKEHMGFRGLIKNHFEICGTSPSEDQVKILGKNRGDKLMSLEALFIHRLKPTLNSKDEYKSRVLKLKFWVESGFNVLGFILGSLNGIVAPVFRYLLWVYFFS